MDSKTQEQVKRQATLRPAMSKQLSGNVPGARAPEVKTGHGPTARGFEPLRAEPNGFLVHHLSHSVTLSHSCEVRCAAAHDCCRHSCGLGPDIRARPGGGGRRSHSCSLHHPESSSNAAQHMATWPAHLDSEGIRTPAGRAQWISSPSP